jgi:RimJ/RimL family protein N-acetyltransferase
VGLNVRANNPAGRRLYAAAGFEEWGSRRDLGGRWLMLYRRP